MSCSGGLWMGGGGREQEEALPFHRGRGGSSETGPLPGPWMGTFGNCTGPSLQGCPGVPWRPHPASAGVQCRPHLCFSASFLAVPGEVPRDPALQVREPAAHPSCHFVLGGAEQPASRLQFLCLPFPTPAAPDPSCSPPPAPSLCSFCLMRGCLLGWVVSAGLRKVLGIRLKDPRWEK